MAGSDLLGLGATEIAHGIKTRQFSSKEVVLASIERIDETNKAVNAVTEIRPEAALAAAQQADELVAQGKSLGPLHGLPTIIKGNVDLAGWATVNGCAALLENAASQSSPCVQNWLNAGAIVVARSNTPEFCCRWETNNSVFGQTSNPWDAALTPGGSSGGTAAALATGMVALGHGTDLGGSLRHPAQCCGVASLKPTFGRVPDCVPTQPEPPIGMQLMNTDGPMARRIADVRLGLECMVTQSPSDPWSVQRPLVQEAEKGLPLALVVDPMGRGVHPQVESGVKAAANLLQERGFVLEEVEPPRLEDAFRVWRLICLYELLTVLKPDVEAICGTGLGTVLAHYEQAEPELSPENYVMALSQRHSILREWQAFFSQYAAIIAPVSTKPPQPIDYDLSSADINREVIDTMRMVVPINALGLPSAVVPVGVVQGLPQAVQVIGAPYRDLDCLSIAEHIESGVPRITPLLGEFSCK